MTELFNPRSFGIGMLALLNPCGFALLPAYLGLFLGLDDDDENRSTIIALNRAQTVGLSMSAGFLLVFGLLGLVFAGLLTAINPWLPTVTIVMGVALLILGVAMIGGFQPVFKIPKLNKGGSSGSVSSMFVFGVSYAVASLSCTLPVFMAAVVNSSSADTFGGRMGAFVSYAIGMGLLAMVLTLGVAFGKKGLVNSFRKVLPIINRVSGIILLVVGAYVILYGIWFNQLIDDTPGLPTEWISSIVEPVENFQGTVSRWLEEPVNLLGLFGQSYARTTYLGWGFLIINVALAAAGFFARQRRSAPTEIAGFAKDPGESVNV